MNLKLVVIAIIIVLVVISVAWYLYSNTSQQSYNAQPSADTTTNILNDLNQIPKDSSVNNEMNSLNQNLQNF